MQEELLKQTYKAMHRKFPQSAKVWLRQIACHQKKGDSEAARKMLQSATQSLPARKHIKVNILQREQEIDISLNLLLRRKVLAHVLLTAPILLYIVSFLELAAAVYASNRLLRRIKIYAHSGFSCMFL